MRRSRLTALVLALGLSACGPAPRGDDGGGGTTVPVETGGGDGHGGGTGGVGGGDDAGGDGGGGGGAGPSDVGLDGEHTLAVVAGVLTWPSPDLASFDPTDRRDLALHAFVTEALGVPAERARRLLDEEATKAAILENVRDLAAMALADDTILFYFAGHGTKDDAGAAYLANYDIDLNDYATGLTPAEIAEAFDAAPRGARVLVLGDFCYSGALREVADELSARGLFASSLTSADASNVSTGNWTYTQTLLEVLAGGSLGDRDGDGAITLGEAALEVADAMKFVEHQRSGFAGLEAELVLAATAEGPAWGAAGAPDFPNGTYAVLGDGTTVRVLEEAGGEAEVLHLTYAGHETFAVPVADLGPIAFEVYPVGTALVVDYDGSPYDAVVAAVEEDFHLVAYEGYGPEWDEWILSDRILEVRGL